MVHLFDGKLLVSGLEYQVYDTAGNATNLNFYGEGTLAGDQLRIAISRTEVMDFTVSRFPTPESVEFTNGYEHAMRQQRRRWPGENASTHFKSGWYQGWKSRGRV